MMHPFWNSPPGRKNLRYLGLLQISKVSWYHDILACRICFIPLAIAFEIKNIFHFQLIVFVVLVSLISLRGSRPKKAFFGKFFQILVGWVADSQTRSKTPNHPANRLFWPEFHHFPKSHKNPGVAGWVGSHICENFPKKLFFDGSLYMLSISPFIV